MLFINTILLHCFLNNFIYPPNHLSSGIMMIGGGRLFRCYRKIYRNNGIPCSMSTVHLRTLQPAHNISD